MLAQAGTHLEAQDCTKNFFVFHSVLKASVFQVNRLPKFIKEQAEAEHLAPPASLLRPSEKFTYLIMPRQQQNL